MLIFLGYFFFLYVSFSHIFVNLSIYDIVQIFEYIFLFFVFCIISIFMFQIVKILLFFVFYFTKIVENVRFCGKIADSAKGSAKFIFITLVEGLSIFCRVLYTY